MRLFEVLRTADRQAHLVIMPLLAGLRLDCLTERRLQRALAMMRCIEFDRHFGTHDRTGNGKKIITPRRSIQKCEHTIPLNQKTLNQWAHEFSKLHVVEEWFFFCSSSDKGHRGYGGKCKAAVENS